MILKNKNEKHEKNSGLGTLLTSLQWERVLQYCKFL